MHRWLDRCRSGCPLEMTGVTRPHLTDLFEWADMAAALAAITKIDQLAHTVGVYG